MSQFSTEEFRDSIDDMCDDALRRMFAIQEVGPDAMQDDDLYICDEIDRDSTLEVIEFNTSLKTIIIDSIHRELIEGEIPDYTLAILSGAVVALSKRAAHLGRGSTVLVPEHESARAHVDERLLMQEQAIKDGHGIRLFAQELGSLGLVNLALERQDNEWNLYYNAVRRTALLRF